MEYREDLTANRLREVLRYDPQTGIFRWRVSTNGFVKIGMQAGTTVTKGYIVIKVDSIIYRAHRLAWLYMTGKWPSVEIDHKNLITSDNRWINLRESTRSQNKANVTANKNNKLGLKGVCFHKASGKYRAAISVQGKHIWLGLYETPEEAARAHATGAMEHFGEFART